jgi:pimeloyl-ACP methyl ester carboxylesterase
MKNSTGIIFIHGAGLNSSIWNSLKNELNVPVLAVDFPNRKSDSNENNKLSFTDYINTTANQIKSWNQDNFIIVAHSIGALVGLKMANQFEDRLKGFIAISSVIPKNGNSFVSSLPFPNKLIMPLVLKFFGTKPPVKNIENGLCNDLTAEQTRNIVTAFTPESKALYMTKINYDLPNVNRLYIKLTNDKSMPLSLQDNMAKNLNADKVAEIDSGHLPMINRTNQITQILSDFISKIVPNNKTTNRQHRV